MEPNAPVVPLLIVTDELGSVVAQSDGWNTELGDADAELLGEPIEVVLHDDDRQIVIRWLGELHAQGSADPVDVRIRRADGTFAVFHFVGVKSPVQGFGFAAACRIGDATAGERLTHPSGLELQMGTNEAFVTGARVDLTRTEFDLLALLLLRRGRVVGHDEIARAVWRYERAGDPNYMQAHLSHLRRKLARAGVHDVIETVRGVGYLVR